MKKGKITILVLEDRETWADSQREVCEGLEVEMLHAVDVSEALALYEEHQRVIDGIVADRYIKGAPDDRHGEFFVQELRDTFGYRGPIVGSSSEFNSVLLLAGADEAVDFKEGAIIRVLALIKGKPA